MFNINVAIVYNSIEGLISVKNEVEKCEDIKIIGEFNNDIDMLSFIKNNRVDVIIYGLDIDSENYISLLEQINTLSVNKTQVIIISHISNQDIINKVMNSGVYYYLLRPYDSNLLLSKVRDSIRQKDIHSLNFSNYSNKEDDSDELKITKMLKDLGTPPHLKGYWFLKEAILLASRDECNLKSIARCIYPNIANKYSTTSSKVERGIRRAIEITCERGNKESLLKMFNIKSKSDEIKITNHQFISILARKLN